MSRARPSKPRGANSATSHSSSSAAAKCGSGATLESHPCRSEIHVPPPAQSHPDLPSPFFSLWPSASAPTPRSSASSTACSSSRCPIPTPTELVALWLNAPGAGGMANFADGLRLSPSMYFTFARTQPQLSVDGRLDPGHGQRYRPCPAGGGAHRAGQRWRAADARRSSRSGPLVFAGRPGSARRKDRDAELRLLAAAFRR